MTTIIDSRTKNKTELCCGDWFYLIKGCDKALCVIAQVSSGQYKIIAFSGIDANRLVDEVFYGAGTSGRRTTISEYELNNMLVAHKYIIERVNARIEIID